MAKTTKSTRLKATAAPPGPFDALLPLLACPVSGEALAYEPDASDAPGSIDGVMRSPGGRVYPVIGGVPRLLPPDLLLPFLKHVYPEVLSRRPEIGAWLQSVPDPEPAVLETLTGYSFQHVDLADDELLVDDWRFTWDRFQPGLPPEAMAGEVVLDVGCGEGRHAWLVAQHARTLVGLDLSRGVELSRRRDARETSFYVQGDLRRPPFRPEVFDTFYSNGVLHHTPVPAESFAAVARLVRRGGRVSFWVYGLEGMRLTYRLSHLTWVRPLTNRLPKPAQMALATAMTAGLEAGLWMPIRVLKRAGLDPLAERLPYADAADRDWQYKVRRMFDRLNPPITHYPTQADLGRWLDGYGDVRIVNTEGQGWSARGTKA